MAREEAELRRLLHGALRGGTSVVLATVSEDGVPSTALNSWIVAKDERIVALAVDARSSAYANISAGRTKLLPPPDLTWAAGRGAGIVPRAYASKHRFRLGV